jgi:alpha-1,3-mannosyltransferase
MLLLYIAVYCMLRDRWTWGTTWFTLALSIKMNILLFMPALGILLLQRMGVWRTVKQLVWIVFVQLALATPFLLVHAGNYFNGAFNFGRAFFYVWTVNLKVLDEETFLSPNLAKGLLMAHVLLIAMFLQKM